MIQIWQYLTATLVPFAFTYRSCLSFRCYNVALNVREAALGRHHPDTASLYSNIGSCLCLMGPKSLIKARYYLRLAEKVLKETLGPYHIRTSTAIRNVSRVRSRTGVIAQPSAGYKQVSPRFDRLTHSKPPPGIEYLRDGKILKELPWKTVTSCKVARWRRW